MDELTPLIKKAQTGDRDAYGAIYEFFLKKIFRFIYYLAGDRILAEDLTQETFLKGWKSIASYQAKKGGSFQAFLYKIARNCVVDWQRKKKEQRIIEGFDVASGENLEETVNKNEDEKVVWDALDKLDEEEKQIMILRYFEDLPTQDVAEIIKVNDGALRVRIHRILKKLKLELEKFNGEI